MERDTDLLLNVTCSRSQNGIGQPAKKLPTRMPDGSRIDSSNRLAKKITKTHQPAVSSGSVFIPRHKLPVLDEFGLTTPSDVVGYEKPVKLLPSLAEREGRSRPTESSESTRNQDAIAISSTKTPRGSYPKPSTQSSAPEQQRKSILKQDTSKEPEIDASSRKAKRKKRKQRDEEPKIIPKEVQQVAGGLPSSFPQYRIKKFTEEYHLKKRKQEEEGEHDSGDEQRKKKRRSFVPGLNPRKREKAANLFTDTELEHVEDLHPYLVQNLKQNLGINKLTKVQSLTMPVLLKTRFECKRLDLLVNSGIGSGKILSYVAPIVNNLALMEPKINRTAGIYALVLLPTRELAAKISEIFSTLCRSFLWVVPGLLTGGERKKSEKARLRKGLNILITTPGRLIDHMDHSEKMDFSKMRYCVLGDAHRLLDPERAEVSKKIAILLRKRLPSNCVRCVVTATVTKKLEKFCEILLDKPTIIDCFKEFE